MKSKLLTRLALLCAAALAFGAPGPGLACDVEVEFVGASINGTEVEVTLYNPTTEPQSVYVQGRAKFGSQDADFYSAEAIDVPPLSTVTVGLEFPAPVVILYSIAVCDEPPPDGPSDGPDPIPVPVTKK